MSTNAIFSSSCACSAKCCQPQGDSCQLQGVLTVLQGHWAFSGELLPKQAMSRLSLCLKLWFPRRRAWNFSMLNCTRIIPAAWPSSSGWQPCSPVVTSCPGFVSPASIKKQMFFPLPLVIGEDVKHNISQYGYHVTVWTPCPTRFQLAYNPFAKTLWDELSSEVFD